jgi:hypothetical protein
MTGTWGEEIKDASWQTNLHHASGLVLHLIVEPGVTPSADSLLPDGARTIDICNQQHPAAETVKALAEQLVLVKTVSRTSFFWS